MRRTLTILAAACLVATAPAAQEKEEAPSILPDSERLEEMARDAERLLGDLAGRMAPMVADLRELIEDLDAYEAPEMLPNGDIIIRRKPETDEPPPEPEGDSTEI